MKRLLSLILPILILPLMALSAEKSVTEVQKGEKWWGLFVSNAPVQPFTTSFKLNTAESSANGFYSPVLISSNGRYIWSEHPMEIDFDGSKITITSDFEKVSAVRAGKNLRDAYLVVCHKFFPPHGEVPDLAMFTDPIYDLTLDLGFRQDQQAVTDYARKIISEGLPAGVIVIPDGWRSQSGGYVFDPVTYPDPSGMVSELHGMGFKVMLTVNPYGAAYGKGYAEGLANGYYMRDGYDKPVIMALEGGLAVAYDISDAEQSRIIVEGMKNLKASAGVDGFRFDCRAVMPLMSGEAKIRKVLDNIVTKAHETGIWEFLPAMNNPVSPYVSGIDLTPDEHRNLLSSVINELVSAGLVGYPYSRISSMVVDTTALFSDPGMMAKFLQLESSMPVFKISFAPWRITDRSSYDAVREAIAFRVEIGDYIRNLVTESAVTAEPLLRHMEYQFPKSGFADCDDQFMLGSKYLFAPLTGSDNRRTVRIPKGVWTDSEGKRYKGPLVTEVESSSGKLIWFQLTGK